MTRKISVLVVDDSALIRSMLSQIINSDPGLEVVDTAADPYEAREKIKSLNPDVLTLDIEMPRMDGISFLKNLMRLRPMPVVMISTLTQHGAPATLQALELGAVDFVGKPKTDGVSGLGDYSEEIISKLKVAARARVQALEASADVRKPRVYQPSRPDYRLRSGHLLAIGASTGGTEAIKDVLVAMPSRCPPIVVTQHIPAAFSASFAERVNNIATISVCEAQQHQPILPGNAYIAPGDQHLLVEAKGGAYRCVLRDGEPVNRHKPSVEVLFDSVLKAAGSKRASAAILTGMGADGAEALKRLRDAGAYTIAQNEQSSVVWGMPGAAVKLEAAVDVLALNKVAEHLLKSAIT